MATIAEIKEALEAERGLAFEMAEKSLQSIDTITNVGNFYLQALAIGIGVFALVGAAAVWISSRSAAKNVAEKRIKEFIDSDDGQKFVRAAIEEEVKAQFRGATFVNVAPPQPEEGGNGFAQDPRQKGGS